MQSEARAAAALQAVAPERDMFRSALAATLEQVRALVAAGMHADAAQARVVAELGSFAAGRIRADRFADVVGRDARPRRAVLGTIRHAQQLLTATLSVGDALHQLEVADGDDLTEAVREALATAGRAFAAAYAIELVRAGRDDEGSDEPLLAPLRPERWTRAERDVAPPLVVRVNGADLRVSGFEDLLQGAQKMVLLVDGAAPPAALVRLVTPGVFVMQCRSEAELQRLHDVRGPAIAALMSEEAALFVHQQGRLDVSFLPAELPRRPLRCASVFRQREDLAWLKQLQQLQATAPVSVMGAAEEAAEPGDRLAAWLLRQVELPAV